VKSYFQHRTVQFVNSVKIWRSKTVPFLEHGVQYCEASWQADISNVASMYRFMNTQHVFVMQPSEMNISQTSLVRQATVLE